MRDEYPYPYPPYYDERPHRPGVGTKIARFFLLMAVIIAVVGTVIVSQRLNVETMAFIAGGIVFTVVLSVPFGIMAALMAVYLRNKARHPQMQQPQQMTIPPIVVTMQPPQYQPQFGQQYGGWPEQMQALPRQWETTTLGGTED